MGERPGVSCDAMWRGEKRERRVGRVGFSSERKGEVGTEEAQHRGGGIRGHR